VIFGLIGRAVLTINLEGLPGIVWLYQVDLGWTSAFA
jgi:hypothetical protein